MATLVLTAVGTALGGPIGAAIGAIAGQAIDARLFAPKARHGPRLGELAVQTSSYGTAIPKLFGTMRVAGTVIWSTDLQERRSSSGGGKGRPRTVNHTYSASFAVALSGRPIRAVGRIWADGKLLRGSAGDFKAQTSFRLYNGEEDQDVDPLIASEEGVGGTPAFRGIAYAMFEDLELADYGNRIPLLTFEVDADSGPVSIGAIAMELSEGLVQAGAAPQLSGYAASGDSVRGVLESLAGVFPLTVREVGDKLVLGSAEGEPILIDASQSGAYDRNPAEGQTERTRRGGIPSEVGITYYEPARDYQTGLQRALDLEARQGLGRAERIELAAAMPAVQAKALAESRLARLAAARATVALHLTLRVATIRPGMQVRLEGFSGIWRVARCGFETMRLRLELVRLPAQEAAAVAASPGRPGPQPDLRHGPTTMRVYDLPLYGELPSERLVAAVVAAGAEPGWRAAALSVSFDDGFSWKDAGVTAAPATLGVAATALPAASSAVIDDVGSVEVELLNGAMWLEGRTDAALAGGDNLALLGHELIQFGRAEQVGPNRYRLSRLLRGRFGTEWASSAHQSGDDFLLIDAGALAPDRGVHRPSGRKGARACDRLGGRRCGS